MADDEDIDKFLASEDDKVVTQEDKIDETVEESLGQMGWLWDETIKKLDNDHTCYDCKKEVDMKTEKMIVAIVGSADKGLVAFVSICEDCAKQLEESQKTPAETKD